MSWKNYDKARGPGLFLAAMHLFLTVSGVSAAAFALFFGKIFLAAVLAAISYGIFLRFKRRRVPQKSTTDS